MAPKLTSVIAAYAHPGRLDEIFSRFTASRLPAPRTNATPARMLNHATTVSLHTTVTGEKYARIRINPLAERMSIGIVRCSMDQPPKNVRMMFPMKPNVPPTTLSGSSTPTVRSVVPTRIDPTASALPSSCPLMLPS